MLRNNQISQLQIQIKKLKREKAQLRAFLHELVEAHYRVINQATEPEKEDKMNNLNLSQTPFSFLAKQPQKPTNSCGLAWIDDSLPPPRQQLLHLYLLLRQKAN